MEIPLSVAELAVLLAAADIDAASFVRESSLMAFGPDELRDRLQLARDAVLARRLAAADDGGPMRAAPPVRAALERLARPQRAFELMHARSGARPARAQFGLAPDGAVALRHGADDERVLVTDVARADIAAEAEAMTAAGAPPSAGRQYVVSASVMARLAAPEGAEEGALLRLLAEVGMGPEDAASFLSTGLRPERQTVFTALALDGGRVRAQAILCFGGGDVTWLVVPVAEGSAAPRFAVSRAGPDDVRRAVGALLAA